MASEIVGNVSNPSAGGIKASDNDTVQDDIKFLREGDSNDEGEEPNEDEEETTEESTTDDSDDSESDETEDDDSEDDKDEDDEEEDDETEEPTNLLVTSKDLKTKYPDIFKKFPELKGVIYREQQYSGIFANPEEAQRASVDAENFHEIEGDLINGNIAPLLGAVKGTKKADFTKLASGILPALEKLDEATYHKVIAVPLKSVLRAAFVEGQRKKNNNLAYSAQHIHDFIFDSMDLNEKSEFEGEAEKKSSPEEERYKKKIEDLDKRDHDNFKVLIDDAFISGVKEAFFDKFDPDGVFSQWVKDRMLGDALMEVNKQLIADPRHIKNMEALWRQAKASGYNTESKTRIVNTVLARAKQVIPTVRQKIRNEALANGNGKGKTEKKKFKVVPKEGTQRTKSRTNQPKKELSDLDIIRGA